MQGFMQNMLGAPWTQGPGPRPPASRTKQAAPLYVLLIGSTGAGKSTLVNTMVNHFRAPQSRRRLPQKSELLVAIPTAHLAANQPEASQARERCVENRKPPPSAVQKLVNALRTLDLDQIQHLVQAACRLGVAVHGVCEICLPCGR